MVTLNRGIDSVRTVRVVYLSGPMRGLPDWNRDAFMDAEALWKARGWRVFNPHRLAAVMGYAPGSYADGSDADRQAQLRHVIHCDFAHILASDAVVLLPDWEKSKGCTMEVALAQFLEMDIYNVTGQRLLPGPTPWADINRLSEALQNCFNKDR